MKDFNMSLMSRKQSAVKAVEDAADAVSSAVSSKATALSNTVKEDVNAVGDALSNGAAEVVTTVSDKLKAVGVDTDAMTSAAKDQASELQKLLAEELRMRPLRALGVAAAIGVVVGLMTAR